MNTLPAAEIKRRGIAALEEGLKQGPVHILKRNRPAAVVLTEEDYQRLQAAARSPGTGQPSGVSAIDYLLSLPAGDTQPEGVQLRIEEERGTWNER